VLKLQSALSQKATHTAGRCTLGVFAVRYMAVFVVIAEIYCTL